MIGSNILWGVMRGIAMAIFFSLIALLIYGIAAVRGLEEHELPLYVLIASYFAGGIAGGVIVGLLRPLGKWWWGGAVMGIFALFPAVVSVLISLEGWVTRWDRTHFVFAIMYSVVVGSIVGVMLWRKHQNEMRSDRSMLNRRRRR